MRYCWRIMFLVIAVVAPISQVAADTVTPTVGFNRVILPLLSSKCFACHGPDAEERQAELRLDLREAAIDSGAIVPGDPDASELIRRITSTDSTLRMPPAESHEPLSAEQQEQLRHWIAAGAEYETHWAFVPPQRPAVPEVRQGDWPRNDIDRFVLARLEAEGWQPSAEADRYTLVRRLYLDLIGLPPTPNEADAFVHDTNPEAYDTLVERLLKSPHYGERWGRLWLDLARYSDTNGYEKDRPRSMWPYRDWVIQAINDDLPFDQFTIAQIAGDMLPDATIAQRVATGFHRNTMLNEEGGIDPLEYRFYAMVDRVATTGTVWMGLTTGCAQCHTHKYDPITHTDYYALLALLNNADEPDLAIPAAEVLEERRVIQEQIANLEAALASQFPPAAGEDAIEERRQQHLEVKFQEWLANERPRAVAWQLLRPTHLESNLPKLEVLEDGSIFSSGDITKRDVYKLRFDLTQVGEPITALRIEVLPDERLPAGGPGRCYYEGRQGDFFLSEVSARIDERAVPFADASHSYGKISIGSGTADAKNVLDGDGSTGWSTSGQEGQPNHLVLNLSSPLSPAGTLELEMLFERHFAASLGRFRVAAATAPTARATSLPVEIESLLTRDESTWTVEELASLRLHFLRVAPELAEARQPIDKLRDALPAVPQAMVLLERPADNPRPTFRHHRGEYLSPKEDVKPAIPAIFVGLTAQPPTDRLSFARWLVSEGNPLVARVTVDRAWRAFFGAGLVRTDGDFGTQSEPPTHPELLDWLAIELVDRGWSLKQFHRLIVSSATYRQSSLLSAESLLRDPENRLLARSARYRVDAEVVRDIMLHASGLFAPKMFGPSVYPPQPAGVTELAYGNAAWNVSTGEDRYRRSLYTFNKRTAPFAAYTVFDAPTGENCVARRNRSNTPLQSLTMLNDPMYVEFARAIAEKQNAIQAEETSREEVATRIFRQLLTRPPSSQELAELLDFQAAQQRRLESSELPAATILGRDDAHAATADANFAERAAWVMVARAIMNLDEAITRQ